MIDEHEHDLAKLLAGANLVLERYLGTPGNSATDRRYQSLTEVRDSIDRALAHYRVGIFTAQLRQARASLRTGVRQPTSLPNCGARRRME